MRVSNDNSSFTSGGVTLSAARVPGVVAVRMHPLQRGSAHIGDSRVIADERVALVLDGPASPFSFRSVFFLLFFVTLDKGSRRPWRLALSDTNVYVA